jgi:hypothetical protein
VRGYAGVLLPAVLLLGLTACGWTSNGTSHRAVHCAANRLRRDYLAEAEATVFGSFRLRQQIQACEHWPAGPLPGAFHRPRTVDVPALLISAELDQHLAGQ